MKQKVKSRKRKAIGLAISNFPLLTFCFLLLTCEKNSEQSQSSSSSPKFTQYYNQGEQLFTKHCSNCHQSDGTGLGRVYPPLNVSDFMDNNFEEVICLIRYGRSGELIVNGINFNQPMPGVGNLTDLEIAEITTYIYNTWSHKKGIAEVKDVTVILNSCQP
jgi:cytochrome c551